MSGSRGWSIRRRMRYFLERHVPHPYVAVFAMLSAIVPIRDGIDWVSDPSQGSSGLVALVIRTGVLITLAASPHLGSIAVAAVIAIDCIAPIPYPSSMVFAGMVALAYVSYARSAQGLVMAVLLAALSLVSMWLYPQSALRAGGGYGFALIYLLCSAIGIMYRINEMRTVQLLQNTVLLGNAKVAQHLHDFTTNDLSDIILLIDRERRDGAPDQRRPSPQTLGTIRDLATDALGQTRRAIVTLEQPYERPKERQSAGTELEQTLFELIDEQQDLLESLGFHGTVVIPDHHLRIADPRDGRLVLGFLKELFGNVSRHADPARGYTVVISADDGWLTITVSDSPIAGGDGNPPEQLPTGMGSGLARYRAAIEARNGTWSLENLDNQWTLGVHIPLAADSTPVDG